MDEDGDRSFLLHRQVLEKEKKERNKEKKERKKVVLVALVGWKKEKNEIPVRASDASKK